LGERQRYILVAGGAPITASWAEAAGLDGFGEDAVEAVALCKRLMRRRAGGEA
jgi:5-methyltetrahydrofolate--homocysteine methyltransferase